MIEGIVAGLEKVIEAGAAIVESVDEAIGEGVSASENIRNGLADGLEIDNDIANELGQRMQEVREVSEDALSELPNQVNGDGVECIRENYENVNNVLSDISQKAETAETEVEFTSLAKRVETYKGTVFEDMCKEELKDKFESVDAKQTMIETQEGVTKPDIVLRDAKEDFVVGNTEIKQGEDLYCEVKCGIKDYIGNQMEHIEKQVLGHQEGKSVVIVTKDYLEIPVEKRIPFEQMLEGHGSSINIVDVSAAEVESAVYENIGR